MNTATEDQSFAANGFTKHCYFVTHLICRI